ncbi:GyrI-like domain-containing protein [Massilia yuzhufengensis]|jgi:AraC family transcriptional regulator|uniref:Predicted transcriptional regulator YdeE, contains AraC-type DNA-binding domain n=1 Tax=Massilia yuzhufengensis TaxID=1164594 RepID=A0A1I1P2I3_9BURK|nr:GyrI-like domain-containing protein [Massilia yuzhufengensis]SFD01928.1 Predicted transcriptional regulator YdeE, contains AraC-type DNA-binding domain [Massilia yuzhufengensis]
MHISTLTLPEMKLAGLPLAGPQSVLEADLPDIWSTFIERESELGESSGLRYGVRLQEKEGVHLACVAAEVADLNHLPPGMIGIRIPARRYAMLTHRGPMARVEASYLTGFAAMEQLGMVPDEEGWRIERYDRRYTPSLDDGNRPDNAYDILIPLL